MDGADGYDGQDFKHLQGYQIRKSQEGGAGYRLLKTIAIVLNRLIGLFTYQFPIGCRKTKQKSEKPFNFKANVILGGISWN